MAAGEGYMEGARDTGRERGREEVVGIGVYWGHNRVYHRQFTMQAKKIFTEIIVVDE